MSDKEYDLSIFFNKNNLNDKSYKKRFEKGILLYKQLVSMWCKNMEEENHSNLKGTTLECRKCFRIWQYFGKNPYYATCTFCKTSVNVRKNKVIQADSLVAAENQPEDRKEKARI